LFSVDMVAYVDSTNRIVGLESRSLQNPVDLVHMHVVKPPIRGFRWPHQLVRRAVTPATPPRPRGRGSPRGWVFPCSLPCWLPLPRRLLTGRYPSPGLQCPWVTRRRRRWSGPYSARRGLVRIVASVPLTPALIACALRPQGGWRPVSS